MRTFCHIAFISFSLLSASLFAKREEITLKRADGSLIQGYLDRPAQESFPIVIFVEGSHEVSVIASHEKLASRFNPHGIGFLSIEKRGITSDKIDKKEFALYDCFEERFSDYALLLKHLEGKKISGYDGNCILLGASEGGKIAPKLSLESPSMIRGVVLIASGGGIPFGEEMKYQSEELIKQLNPAKKLSYKVRGAVLPKEHEQHYEKMLQKPESLELVDSHKCK